MISLGRLCQPPTASLILRPTDNGVARFSDDPGHHSLRGRSRSLDRDGTSQQHAASSSKAACSPGPTSSRTSRGRSKCVHPRSSPCCPSWSPPPGAAYRRPVGMHQVRTSCLVTCPVHAPGPTACPPEKQHLGLDSHSPPAPVHPGRWGKRLYHCPRRPPPSTCHSRLIPARFLLLITTSLALALWSSRLRQLRRSTQQTFLTLPFLFGPTPSELSALTERRHPCRRLTHPARGGTTSFLLFHTTFNFTFIFPHTSRHGQRSLARRPRGASRALLQR